MPIFSYNRQYPCPTDKFVIPIYKEFLKEKQAIVDSWRKGIVMGLMGYRDYVDLNDARMTLKQGKDGLFPVISLKPIVGIENSERLESYYQFFQLYQTLRDELLCDVNESVYFRTKTIRDDDLDEFIVTNVSVIKLLITSWNMRVFNVGIFKAYLCENKMCLLNIEKFYYSLVPLGVTHVLGDVSKRTNHLAADPDDQMIGSFYRYVRKGQSRFNADLVVKECGTSQMESSIDEADNCDRIFTPGDILSPLATALGMSFEKSHEDM